MKMTGGKLMFWCWFQDLLTVSGLHSQYDCTDSTHLVARNILEMLSIPGVRACHFSHRAERYFDE